MIDEKIKQDFDRIAPFLDEKTTRLYVANQALSIGRGGKILVSKALGISRVRINEGIKELLGQKPLSSKEKKRRTGGGRKSIDILHPDIESKIECIIFPSCGDQMNPLRWCSKSLRKIADALKLEGCAISHVSIEKYLLNNNYSLLSNRRTEEGFSEEDRDSQFEYINDKAKLFMSEKEPVISVDCKKMELIDNYKKGWISVSISSDAAQFAVNAVRTWWLQMGRETYPNATKLLITADGGGSNSSKSKLWKKELQLFAKETGLEINVCHYPPGISKWNKIEHRLFSFITMNWREKPLVFLKTIVNLIANPTMETGIEVRDMKDMNIYQKVIKVSDEEMNEINLKRDDFRGNWNFSISKKM